VKILAKRTVFVQAPNILFREHKEKNMKVKVTENCMGDRRCNDLCPEVFEYDEDQLKSIVKVDEVPGEYKELVRQAAEECGADAIIIEED
jgi:ferredoxin